MTVVSLICHPSSPCPQVREFTAGVDAPGPGLLTLRYRIDGDIDQLQLPPPARPDRTDGLWKQTCFEAFVGTAQSRAYVELNFSPSSAWAMYRFDDYRQGMSAVASARAPRILCRRRDDTLEADVDVDLSGLPEFTAGELKLAVSAVLQDRDGKNSYWALAHAPGKPDFHQPVGFALTLSILNGEAR